MTIRRPHFGRRAEDHSKQVMTARLLSFTDLMAILLTFFVLMYATREPAPPEKIRLNIAPIAPVVETSSTAPIKLATPPKGLELNYVAALLRQAQTRDNRLARAQITMTGRAVVLTLPTATPPTDLQYILTTIMRYHPYAAILASSKVITNLQRDLPDAMITYFPQKDERIRIVLH